MQVLLSRYSRSEDVVSGIATKEPGSAAVKELIGLDCNPVPLRTSFAGEPSRETVGICPYDTAALQLYRSQHAKSQGTMALRQS